MHNINPAGLDLTEEGINATFKEGLDCLKLTEYGGDYYKFVASLSEYKIGFGQILKLNQ